MGQRVATPAGLPPASLCLYHPPMRIRIPKLSLGGRKRRPARPQNQDHGRGAPQSTPPRYKGRTEGLGIPNSRGNTRLKYGPNGKPARTREQLADRADRRPIRQYGYRQTPASDRPEARPRPYPAPKISNLRVRPMVRAGTRFQLAERHEQLAATRARPRAPQGIGVPAARQQLAKREHRGTQVHTYPRPYDKPSGKHTARTPGRDVTLPDKRRVPTGAVEPARRVAPSHPARGVAPRPPAGMPGDVTPSNRLGGSRAPGERLHPFFQKRG